MTQQTLTEREEFEEYMRDKEEMDFISDQNGG